MMKYQEALANLVEFKPIEVEEIETPIKTIENKTIHKLIIDLES